MKHLFSCNYLIAWTSVKWTGVNFFFLTSSFKWTAYWVGYKHHLMLTYISFSIFNCFLNASHCVNSFFWAFEIMLIHVSAPSPIPKQTLPNREMHQGIVYLNRTDWVLKHPEELTEVEIRFLTNSPKRFLSFSFTIMAFLWLCKLKGPFASDSFTVW